MNAKSFLPSFFAADSGAFKLGAKARTSFRPIVWVALCLTLAFAQTGYPVPINILNNQYTTEVDLEEYYNSIGAGLTISRTNSSPVPISDSLYNPVTGQLSAQANAGLFGISANTDAGAAYDPNAVNSHASATSELWFSPLTSQTTTINIQFSGWWQWYYSWGTVSLLDVTSGNEQWDYGWNGFNGTVPWVDTGGSDLRETATLQIDTAFNASDTYYLYMNAQTDSNPADAEQILIQLTGLEPIPEPSTFTLLGLGSLALAMMRRHR